jgi:hypothetical protein
MLLKIFRRVSNLSKHQMGGIYQSRICYRKKNLVGRTVRYSGIDDAIDMINRIGKGGKLAKTDIKSAFRLLKVSPSDFDQPILLSYEKNWSYPKGRHRRVVEWASHSA